MRANHRPQNQFPGPVMTGPSHYLIALGCGLAGAALVMPAEGLPAAALLLVGSLAGSRAPDHLEGEFLNRRIIRHRTLTHWFPFWLLALGFGLHERSVTLLAWLLVGYSAGGLLHLLCDAMTPMGVPILTPWRRMSLRLVKSGAGELVAIMAAVLVAGLAWSNVAHADLYNIAAANAAVTDYNLEAAKPKDCDLPGECGWWWGFDQKTPPKPKQPKPPKASQVETPNKQTACQHAKTWETSCGFVDPKGNFALQAKERDALRIAAVMNPGDQNAVVQFQKYMRWATNEAILFTQMWQYNMQQFPSLNPRAESPISRFGLVLASQVKDANAKTVWQALKSQGAFFVYFTRSDCSFCHAMASTVQRVAKQTNLPIWDASLDNQCLPGFKNCRTADTTTRPAEILHVTIVPTLFVYVPPTNSWIRVSTGVSSVDDILNRTQVFFEAVHNAAEHGLRKGVNGTAPVDFNGQTMNSKLMLKEAVKHGLARGIDPVSADGTNPDE